MSRTSHLSPDNILRFLQLRSEPASTREIADGLQLRKTDNRPLFKMLSKLKKRRAIEELGDDYNRLAYFERTAQALANLMYEKGALRRDEVAARMDAIRKRSSK